MRISQTLVLSAVVVPLFAACVYGGGAAPPPPSRHLPADSMAPATPIPGPTDPPTADPSPAPTSDEPTPAGSEPTLNVRPTQTAEPTQTPASFDGLPRRVPDIVVRTVDTRLELTPYTWCWIGGCQDGLPRPPLDSVGSPESVTIEFPIDEWEFSATFKASDVDCARRHLAEARKTGPNTWTLEPAGYAGLYDVELSGNGRGLDAFVSFRWNTPVDGPLPVPTALIGMVTGHDDVDSRRVELYVNGLAETPETARAEVTLTAANAAPLAFELADVERGCPAEGWLYWTGADRAGVDPPDLGPPPIWYEVVLTLDGVEHIATGSWPDDVIPGSERLVELAVDPPLRSLADT